ncbi:MAG: hypothetical protein OXC93_06790 [Rhodospirillaceae bacterium]|nr:hypothetical protein [Rhodospirillaceae bacterium]
MAEVKKRMVDVVRSSYQPSKDELEADARVDRTFDKAIAALRQPVDVRYINRPVRE